MSINLVNKNHVFHHNANTGSFKFSVLPQKDNLHTQLPTGVYNVVVTRSPMGISIEYVYRGKFELPTELYGDTYSRADRVIASYNRSERNLGAIFAGISGSGKSVTAKLIANRMVDEGNPVLIFNHNNIEVLEDVIEVFASIKQDVCIFLDEYEKIFTVPSRGEESNNEDSKNSQNHLLPLLDGVMDTHNLFILTLNDSSKVNNYFFNRPSRIRYYWEYKNLPFSVINDYINCHIEDENRRLEAKLVMTQAELRTYDILGEFITECSRFPDMSPTEIAEGFNIMVSVNFIDISYDTTFTHNEDELYKEYISKHFDGINFSFYLRGSINSLFNSKNSIEMMYSRGHACSSRTLDATRVNDIRFGKDYIEIDYVIDGNDRGVRAELIRFADWMRDVRQYEIKQDLFSINDRKDTEEYLDGYKDEVYQKIISLFESTSVITLRLTEREDKKKFEVENTPKVENTRGDDTNKVPHISEVADLVITGSPLIKLRNIR